MATHTNEDMKINPQRAAQLIENLKTITERIKQANSNGRKVGTPLGIDGAGRSLSSQLSEALSLVTCQ